MVNKYVSYSSLIEMVWKSDRHFKVGHHQSRRCIRACLFWTCTNDRNNVFCLLRLSGQVANISAGFALKGEV